MNLIKKPLHEAFLFSLRTFQLIRVVCGCTFLLLMWLLSDHHSPWSTFAQEACAAAAITLLYPWDNRQRLSNTLNIAFFTFIGIIFFQAINGVIFFGDLVFAFTTIALSHMAATYGASATVESKKTTINIFFFILLIAATINSLIGLVQWQGFSQGILILESPTGRAYGNLAQPNQLATLILMGVTALIFLDTQKAIRSTIIYLVAPVLFFSLSATESRTGTLSLTIIILAATLTGRESSTFKSLRWLAPGFLFFLALHLNWSSISNHLNGKASRELSYASSSGRIEIWSQMLSAIQIKPWSGWGWLNLGAAQNSVTLDNPVGLNIDHAHNLFIDLIIWLGIPAGGIIIVLIFYWTIKNTISSFNKETKKLAFPLFISLIPIATHSLLEYPFSYLYFLLPAFFVVGTIDGLSKNSHTTKIHKLFRIAYAINIILLAFIALEYVKVEDDFRAIRLERQFITQPEQKHTYNSPPKILTQYGYLIKSNRDDAIPSSAITRQTMNRFPWLMNHQQHYLALLQENKCQAATDQLHLIHTLFGKFGVLKAQEAITRTGIKHQCNS